VLVMFTKALPRVVISNWISRFNQLVQHNLEKEKNYRFSFSKKKERILPNMIAEHNMEMHCTRVP